MIPSAQSQQMSQNIPNSSQLSVIIKRPTMGSRAEAQEKFEKAVVQMREAFSGEIALL